MSTINTVVVVNINYTNRRVLEKAASVAMIYRFVQLLAMWSPTTPIVHTLRT